MTTIDVPHERTTASSLPAASFLPAPPARRDRLTGALSIALGVCVAAVAALGPLGADVIVYHVSDGARAQVMGGDAAGLALVAPAAIVAGIMLMRDRLGGFALALGPAGYAAYTGLQLAISGDATRYAGTSERFLPLFAAIVVLAGAVLVRAWRGTAHLTVAARPRAERALAQVALGGATFLTLGLHLPGLVDVLGGAPDSAEYLADPQVFWVVKAMDLVLVVPALVAFGIAALRGKAWTARARYGIAGWMATLGAAVASMAAVMVATGQPGASLPLTVGFGAIAIAGIVLAGIVIRPALGPRTSRAS